MSATNIEVIDVRKVSGQGNLKAFVDIKFAGCLVVKGFSVLQGKRGLFVTVPKKQAANGQWFEVLTITDDDFKSDIERAVLHAYDEEDCYSVPPVAMDEGAEIPTGPFKVGDKARIVSTGQIYSSYEAWARKAKAKRWARGYEARELMTGTIVYIDIHSEKEKAQGELALLELDDDKAQIIINLKGLEPFTADVEFDLAIEKATALLKERQ